ncbi:O-antigen ligase family protein [Gordonia polyisoprenivorans]|nr:O-antigen ligase family protein [Gordonia polyisoprenivorans]UZF57549.1 O-antigen ligase family protein [Gordonia polyisoprenivorans]
MAHATTMWVSHERLVRLPRVPRVPLPTLFLSAAVALVVAAAPIEGYLIAAYPQLGKVPALVLVGIWLIVRVRQYRLPELQPVHVALAALALVVVLSTAVHLTSPFSVEYAGRWLPFLLTCAVLIDAVAHEVKVEVVFAAALTGAAISAVGAVYSMFASGDLRASGPLTDPNDLAYVLVAALPLAVGFAPHRRWHAILLGGVAVLLALGAATTLSRGGGIALAVAVTWLVIRRVIAIRAVVLAGIGAAVAVGLAWVFAHSLVASAVGQKGYIAASNVDTRLTRWHAAAEMLGTNPILGVGPGGFRSNYVATSHLAEIAEQTPVVHNMYIEVAAELGIAGIVLFIGLIVGALVACERALRLGAEPRVAIAVQASLLAVVSASVSLSEEYYMALWSILAIAYALYAKTAGEARR